MIVRLIAAMRHNRAARVAGVIVLSAITLAAIGLGSSQDSEAAKGTASANGKCARCATPMMMTW